ncbi:MAG: Unknown protein [uncultured Sulfurovum sp.]|uniref:Uncharacterized protein n=1 Tax=uncultured Sulfurovum sp. TaxID=269237 RepID=A0A6S6T7K2_9BACT|nr:MAG: Unknown protein [uncultured Sulfurovum sp.]
MEVTQMLSGHSILVDIFLGFLVLGIVIPFIVKSPAGFKKASFVYTMIFQALATMVAFAGIVAVFTGDLGWPLTTILMMIIWAIMMFIEIKKHKFVKLANLENEGTFKVIKSAFFKISIVQVLLVVVMMVIMIMKANGQ